MIEVTLIILLSGTSLCESFLFGYAKPVPVNFGRLHNPKKDMLWVAAAGPLSNLFMALVWAALLKLAWLMPGNQFTLTEIWVSASTAMPAPAKSSALR